MQSGTLGRNKINHVRLNQELKLQFNQGQDNWYEGRAIQYFSVNPPVFHCNIEMKTSSLRRVVGRDYFNDGKGNMLLKLLSIILVVNVKNETIINQAVLQRNLAEIVWFPSASLSEYIEWESIDDTSVKATISYKGTHGTGIFILIKMDC